MTRYLSTSEATAELDDEDPSVDLVIDADDEERLGDLLLEWLSRQPPAK